MQILRHFILTLTVLIFVACRQTATKETSKLNNRSISETGEFVPINFSDTNYSDLTSYAVDTTTTDGWSIKYFVKDDSTRYKDLYISCNKGNIKSTFRADNVLEFRRYFIPEFEMDTKTNIYFTHGCATDCSAILVFYKDSTPTFTDYSQVVKYNFVLGQILYVTDSSYKDEDDIYELALVDVSRQKTHRLIFHGVCDGVNKPACVDTVIFSKDKVTVTASLRKNIENVDQTRQTKTVRL